MISTLSSDRGPTGYIERLNSTASVPESLRRIAAYLSRSGYMTDICVGILHSPTRPRDLAALSTTMGWLLTWWCDGPQTSGVYGSLWVGRGAGPEILYTSALSGHGLPGARG